MSERGPGRSRIPKTDLLAANVTNSGQLPEYRVEDANFEFLGHVGVMCGTDKPLAREWGAWSEQGILRNDYPTMRAAALALQEAKR